MTTETEPATVTEPATGKEPLETEPEVKTSMVDFDKTGNDYKGPDTFPKHTQQYFQFGFRWQKGARDGYGEDSTYYPTPLLLEHLESNEESLRVLDLCGRALTDPLMEPIVAALEGNTSVTELLMSRNKMNHSALPLMETLKSNASVTVLKLKSNDLRGQAIRALAEMLKHNTSIVEIDLTCNPVKADAKMIAEALGENRTLRTLRLDNCGIEDDGAMALLEALEAHPSILDFSAYNNCCVDKDLRKRMRGFSKLKSK